MMLSKSRYMAGRQCAKRLWFEVHERTALAPADAATQAVFDQGNLVGRLAQGLFPGGIAIDPQRLDWERALADTAAALAARVPLYEAAFAHQGAACRVDILVPAGDGAWDLVEVKSTSSMKDEHVEDAAFQTWILRGSGVPVRRTLLGRLNGGYVRRGPLHLEGLFALDDLTELLAPLLPELPAEVARLHDVLARAAFPPTAIGPHCSKPYNCPLRDTCWADVPGDGILTLAHGGRRGWELYAAGIRHLMEIPPAWRLSRRQRIQVEAVRAGVPHIDRAAIAAFLGRLQYPVHFFDLESYMLAIPPFDDTRPYEQIPFQFSLQVVDAPGAAPRTVSFLAEDDQDPRSAFLAAARAAIGSAGSVVAYNAQFERLRLRECARAVPSFAAWVAELEGRFLDLLEPFRSFDYYHPAQLGSASLKAVLPALAGAGYEDLEIQEGDAAARVFLRSLDPATAPPERRRIRESLLAYCGRDTEGMVELVAALRRLVADGDVH